MPRRFDFEANHWIDDGFLEPIHPRSTPRKEIPPPDTEPEPGRWNPAASTVPSSHSPAQAFAAFVKFRLLAHEAHPEDLRLLEDPDDPEVCLVAIQIGQDGVSIGEDRGAAWFEEGRLLFSGRRTSFAIGGEDVLPQSQWHRFDVGEHPAPLSDETLPLRTSTPRCVVFVPLLRSGAIGADQRTRFEYKFSRFRRLPPQSKGPRQWPPFDAQA